MIRQLYSIISFNVWVAALALLSACADAQRNGVTHSSQTACAGDGGLAPISPVPQNFVPPKKFSILETEGVSTQSSDVAVLSKDTPLVVVLNEICVLENESSQNWFSEQLEEAISTQRSKSQLRAYSLKTKEEIPIQELRVLAEEDTCLIQVSRDVQIRTHASVNDTYFSLQTHLTAIKAPDSWDTFHSNLTEEVVIAIIDDGIELSHSDIADVTWENSGETVNGVDDDGNGYVDDINGYNFSSNLSSPEHQASKYHGTHVAGLAAAQGNNGIGVTGVMGRNAKIMHLNVFGTNATISSANIINALNYARLNGADVINLSLGGLGTSAAMQTALSAAVSAGIFVTASAGNDNIEVTASTFYIPMGYAKDLSGMVSVGSVDATTLERSSFSNYSSTYVEITAPGSSSATGGVLSTYTSNNYAYLQGTSMSSPVVAGAAALLIAWARSQGHAITPAQVESQLKSSATASSALVSYVNQGHLLNMLSLAEGLGCSF